MRAAASWAAVNLVDRRRGAAAASAARIAAAFDGRALALPPSNDGNTIAIAAAESGASTTIRRLRARAAVLRNRTGLDLAPSVKRLSMLLGAKGAIPV